MPHEALTSINRGNYVVFLLSGSQCRDRKAPLSQTSHSLKRQYEQMQMANSCVFLEEYLWPFKEGPGIKKPRHNMKKPANDHAAAECCDISTELIS